jgi:hypothetical protein
MEPVERDPRVLALAVVLAVAIPAAAVALLVGLAQTAGDGLVGLSADNGRTSTGAVIKSALVLAALSGVLAAAGTEFLKRLLRLQTWFNRNAVRGFLGELAEFKWTARRAGLDGFPQRPVPPTYSAPLSQVCAQLANTMSLLTSGLMMSLGNVNDLDFDRDHQRAAAEVILGPGGWAFWEREIHHQWLFDESLLGTDRARPEVELLLDALSRQAERQLDAFQLRTRARWRLILQWISAILAGGFMLCVSLAQDLSAEAVAVGCVLGMVIGGPVSWAVRDLVRFIETKAA